MGDRDEPTVKDRPRLNTPTVDVSATDPGTAPPAAEKITEPTSSSCAFDQPKERFEHRGELGRGGMGRVDDAYDVALGRPVAIKHMLTQSEIDLARFEREARLTARLEHPGIVPIHDAGRSSDGTPYYVMRRVDGQPLSDLVEKRPLSDRLKVIPNILAACDAAGFAHARGIVHRDIKPTNILVGPFGETLLIDWGLARELGSGDIASPSTPPSDPQLTRAGTVAGTPGFMSPEQARGESVDARADVFALGATLFYALSGELPWHGGSTEMINHVGAGRPPDWRKIPREVPPDLRAIVEKAMAPNIADRYPDAGALAADLRRFTLGNLVAAYEYGVFAKLGRFARRHRGAMLVALVSAIVLAAVALVSVRRIVAERDAANGARALAETRQREARFAADRLLVKHARELVDDDPVEAIAALRTLPADSPNWPEAWAAASAAYMRGVPFGFIGLPEPSSVQISVDDRHAFAFGMHDGMLMLIDLETRTKKVLDAKLGRPFGASWLDATHIICALETNIVIIDITTGEKRELPIPEAQVWSNRHNLTVLLSGQTLYELTSASGEPQQIDTGIVEYAPSPDLKSAVIVRATGRELWVNGATYKVPAAPPEIARYTAIYLVRDKTVAILQGATPLVFDLVGDQLVERPRHAAVPGIRAMATTLDDVYIIDTDSIRTLGPQPRSRHVESNSVYQEEDGFVLAVSDGSLLIQDSRGVFKLGKRHSRYQRLDRSPDGRFLIATTDAGEVLVWDLSKIRPTTIAVAHDETPIAVTDTGVWVVTPGEGVSRIDLKTRRREMFVPTLGAFLQLVVGKNDEWAAALDQAGHGLRIARRGEVLLAADDVSWMGGGMDEVVFVSRSNELWRWHDGRKELVLKLPSQPTLVADGTRFAIIGFGADLMRLDFETKHEERVTLPAIVDAVAVDSRGTTWMVANGQGYRWDRAAPAAVRLDLGDTVDGVLVLETRATFHGLRTIIEVSREGQVHAIAHASQWASALDGDRLVTATSQGLITVLDVANAASFELPIERALGYPVVISPRQIGVVYWHPDDRDLLLGLIPIDVPNQPAELQRWLTAVTNAKPVPNSEAIAWPN